MNARRTRADSAARRRKRRAGSRRRRRRRRGSWHRRWRTLRSACETWSSRSGSLRSASTLVGIWIFLEILEYFFTFQGELFAPLPLPPSHPPFPLFSPRISASFPFKQHAPPFPLPCVAVHSPPAAAQLLRDLQAAADASVASALFHGGDLAAFLKPFMPKLRER